MYKIGIPAGISLVARSSPETCGTGKIRRRSDLCCGISAEAYRSGPEKDPSWCAFFQIQQWRLFRIWTGSPYPRSGYLLSLQLFKPYFPSAIQFAPQYII